MACARTFPVPRIQPADRRGVVVDLRRRHVGSRDGAAGHRTRQRSRIAVVGRHLSGRRPGRVPTRRRPRGRPDEPTHDHHRRRDRQRGRRDGDRGAGTRWCAADLAYGGGRSGDGHRRGVLLPGLQRDPAQDPACRPTSGRQRRRRRGAPGLPARRRPCRRRHRGRCDLPCAGVGRGGSVVRRRPVAAGGNRNRDENACPRTGSGTATDAARLARRLRLHAAHAVAAVDPAVREHVRAGGAGTDRGAAAVHRQGPVRRRRPDVRLHPGVLRDGQRAGRARRCRRDGCPVATCR